uniref:DNA-directed DNA polymerase n=1 Tax=Ascaris lumbricoides TaxID=6252 RepID=A0A0M3IQ00_ASCLU
MHIVLNHFAGSRIDMLTFDFMKFLFMHTDGIIIAHNA